MKMKKIATVLISTLMVLNLAACGNQSTQNRQNSVSAAQPANESTAPEVSNQEAFETQSTEPETSEMQSTESESSEIQSTEQETLAQSDISTETDEGKKILVVYYSATGTTAKVANNIAAATDADLFELQPVEPYTSDDLNWTDDNSRVVYEHDNPDARNVELVAATVDDWESYDTVFIGYPIWWQIAAWPINNFIAANDFTGKTVIPFCTSSSSGLGESGRLLEAAAGTGNWLAGERFSSGASEADVQAWIEGLGL